MAPLRIKGKSNLMQDVFLLLDNPFRVSQIYNPDQPGPYVREMYGKQLAEFQHKFFLNPLQKEGNRQVIGALWSSHAGNALGKGYGKSMLMAEESRLINKDFGAATLKQLGADEEDIPNYPFLSGYCSFVQAREVKSFPAALLDAIIFILDGTDDMGTKVHEKLLERIADRHNVDPDYPGESIRELLWKHLQSYSGLSLQLNHKTTNGFINRLCHHSTEDLVL